MLKPVFTTIEQSLVVRTLGMLSADDVRTLRELARSYLSVTQDLTRVMNRLTGLYRSWAIPCAGRRMSANLLLRAACIIIEARR